MIEEMVTGYKLALSRQRSGAEIPEPNTVKMVRRRALGRHWRHLAQERIEDTRPTIPLGRKFWALTKAERNAVDALFSDNAVQQLVVTLNGRSQKSTVTVVDAAYWMKGCSSLGKLRYAALVALDGKGRKRRYALVDIKEAVEAVAPAANGAAMPAHCGARVVAGAKALSPNLGDRVLAADFLGRPVFLRELMPQDLKLEIDQFTRDEAVASARYLAYVVGRVHVRQMDPPARNAWHREMDRHRRGKLDAPHWLWSSVVTLAARHEEAYLEHCRRFALNKGG